MLDRSAVEAIAELAKQADQNIVGVNGVMYGPAAMYRIDDPEPEPNTLVVHTLAGLVKYIDANRDGLDLQACTLHVVGPERVDLLSELIGPYNQRFTYVSAVCDDRFAGAPLGFRFGKWMEVENMLIAVQALFEDRGQRADVLRVLGNVRNEAVKTQTDDGVTQEVTVRSGIQVVEQTTVPNPVRLAPFRTFAEVEQPESPFIFRMRKAGDAIDAALFEADGGAWRGEAIELIAEWLRAEIEDVNILS